MHQTLTNPEAAAPARLRRLLVVMPSYYPDTYGGAERQAKLLSGALAEKGVEITLIHPILQDGLPEREDAPFGEIRRIRTRSFPANGGRQIGSFIAWTRKLSAWIRAHGAGFDAIYVFHARLHVLGALLGAAAVGKPIFVKIGGGGLGSDFAALRAKRYLYGRWVQTRAVSQVDAFIAPSRQVEEDLAALGVGPERIWAIPNGVVALTGEALEAAFTQRAGKRFICVGRVETLKRADLAVEAAGELAKRTRDFELLFLGDGPLLAPLQARVAELGLADQVRFLGRVGDVYPHLLAADYFLMPSLREGQSNALLEGLSAGLPALCGAASGVSDIVQDGVNGFVVDSDAPAAWAEAMARLIDLPAHARIGLGRAAHARTQPISIDATAQLTLDLINERLAARER